MKKPLHERNLPAGTIKAFYGKVAQKAVERTITKLYLEIIERQFAEREALEKAMPGTHFDFDHYDILAKAGRFIKNKQELSFTEQKELAKTLQGIMDDIFPCDACGI